MFKNHFPMLFNSEIFEFDERPLKLGIKGLDIDRILISQYSAIFSCESETIISIFLEHPNLPINKINIC